jgi:oxepin-CoA hydrolase/3-oxo-5,6-dehydrosuberyl-CoA semialdehyde dehydrogenase
VRFVAETDSLNSSILGPDATPGTPEFDLYVREVVREMTSKAGQKCTAIRKAIVPQHALADVAAALSAALGMVVVGNPREEGVRMGPLATLDHRREVLGAIERLQTETATIVGGGPPRSIVGADSERGAFVSPVLLECRQPRGASLIHSVEAFGPVATLMPYADVKDAIALARLGGGSLAGSLFTADDAVATEVVLGLAPYHGRVLVVNRDCSKESTGHGSPLAHLVHGGPGRAGGGEEMGGVRGVLHYMQRTAVQGSPQTLTAIGGTWIRGSTQLKPTEHPFR